MVVQAKDDGTDNTVSTMRDTKVESRTVNGNVAVRATSLCNEGEFAAKHVDVDDESREPDFHEKEAESDNHKITDSLISEEASAPDLNGASDELAEMLERFRRRRQQSSAPELITTRSAANEERDAAPEVRDDVATRAENTTNPLCITKQVREKSLVDTHSSITNETRQDGSKESTGSITEIALDDTIHDATNKLDTALSTMAQFQREDADRKIDDTIDDANTKLDAALSMMAQFQREDADRKILSMMEVKQDNRTDSKTVVPAPATIDWETGENNRTPWVGQVGINDELFEDEPLEYAETGPSKRQQQQVYKKETCVGLTGRRKLMFGTVAVFAIVGALGAFFAISKEEDQRGSCPLCYDGTVPTNLGSSMVGGQTCADFRTSLEAFHASDAQCLQGQSLAWLMCDCPSLPPFPENPSCTLCGEGVLLKGSACNHMNTFMAHITDKEYCTDLKKSVSKAGCACPKE